jgi:hypothetical protein
MMVARPHHLQDVFGRAIACHLSQRHPEHPDSAASKGKTYGWIG